MGKKKGSLKVVQEKLNPAPYLRLLERVDQQVAAEERGDMLIFLSGPQHRPQNKRGVGLLLMAAGRPCQACRRLQQWPTS